MKNSMTKVSLFKNISLALAWIALCINAPLRAGEQVPFKGHFDLTISSAPTPVDATHVQFGVDATARVTLLGQARGPGVVVLDVTNLSYVGEATWLAANGDSVVFTFEGQFVPSDTPSVLNNVETFEIVGGTGRFEGATGSGTADGQLDAATLLPLSPAPIDGTISSPGSLQKGEL